MRMRIVGIMPRYYFDLTNGDTKTDTIGADLENDAAARQEAQLRAINGAGQQMAHFTGSRAIAVRNQYHQIIFKTFIKRHTFGDNL